MKKYTTTEYQAMESLLKKVSRDAKGTLPVDDWVETPEMKLLLKNHKLNPIKQKLQKIWKESVIPIQVPTEKVQLNHAYNFCPGCGMRLN